MLHNIHTLNPTCSAKIENTRLRRATARPVVSQKTGSSGRQSSIQCRLRGGPGARTGLVAVVVAVAVVTVVVVVMGPPVALARTTRR